MKSEQAKKERNCLAISYAMAKQARFRRRSSAKSHAEEIMSEPILTTALLSLVYLPRAIRLARRPVVPAARKAPPHAEAIMEPTPPPTEPAVIDETALLRAWSAENIGRRESLEMLADYVINSQSIYNGRWRATSIPILCGYREDIYMLFEKIHDDDELSTFRESLFRQLHRRRDEERMLRLRNAWPAIEREARRFAAVRERRRLHEEDYEPRELQDRFKPGR